MLRASSGRLVGRDGELTRLLGLLDDASAGRPSHALISGDAGVGKTRLVAELAARAADRGFLVLSGRCAELGDSIPYLPLADALREGTTTPEPQRNRWRPHWPPGRCSAACCRTGTWPRSGAVRSPGSPSSSCSGRCSGCSPSWPTGIRCC